MNVSFYIIEGSVVGLILLGLIKESEQMVCALVVGKIVVDEADKDALALRELLEAVLKIALRIVGINVSEFRIDLTVIRIVTVVEALLEESLCGSFVTSGKGGETGIVN